MVTVSCPVVALATSEACRAARNCNALTNVVVRWLPFHCTEEPEVNPAPLRVIVGAELPGAAVMGARGVCNNGTALEGAELMPVPVRVAGMGETAVAKVTFTVAEKVPVAAGVNVALMVQVAPAARVPQLLVWEKSAGLVP